MPAPADLVFQQTTGTGANNLALTTVAGKRTFASAFGTGNTNTFDYFISSKAAAEWEIGVGYIDATSGDLVRNTVSLSSNSNSAVNFGAGTKDITNDLKASDQCRGAGTVTNNHAVLFDGTSGSLIKSAGFGLGSIASQAANNVSITGGSISSITDLAVADGGTGASDAATARTNLGLGTISTQDANNVAITGGAISGLSSGLPVASGGTGRATLTANNVILGNGTSAVSFVAPSTNGNVLTSNGTTWTSTAPAVINGNTIQRATAIASTSGTAIDFTGIPSWAKKITIIFYNVSTSGTANKLVQVGITGASAGTFVTTGYNSTCITYRSGSTGSTTTSTAGFIVASSAAADVVSGSMLLLNITSNTWVSSVQFKANTLYCGNGGGDIVLSNTLDRVRITTVATDSFDLGTINLMYEG